MGSEMSNRFKHDAEYDRSIFRGDAFCRFDAYIDLQTNKRFWVAAGHDPNVSEECRKFETFDELLQTWE